MPGSAGGIEGTRLPGQQAGSRFERACREFIEATFLRLTGLRPGKWNVSPGGSHGIHRFAQYDHLDTLASLVRRDPALEAALGRDYNIRPDIVISRGAEDVAAAHPGATSRSPLDDRLERPDSLHAVISAKWTIRSDRAQNVRTEALSLIRQRKGHLPHIVVVTGDPLPARIASVALGTGDIDCTYHFALPELQAAVEQVGKPDDRSLLKMMVDGDRLKDIADLPLDLAL